MRVARERWRPVGNVFQKAFYLASADFVYRPVFQDRLDVTVEQALCLLPRPRLLVFRISIDEKICVFSKGKVDGEAIALLLFHHGVDAPSDELEQFLGAVPCFVRSPRATVFADRDPSLRCAAATHSKF